MKKKRLNRDVWTVITDKSYKQIIVNNDIFNGIIGLLNINEVTTAQKWQINGNEYNICDNGMKWLQIVPSNEFYVLTAFINEDHEIVLWYIDMIAEFGIDSDGVAYFLDLYLDLIVSTDGHIIIDDMNELIDAYDHGIINLDLKDLALETCERLQNEIKQDINQFRKQTMECIKLIVEGV